MDISNLSVVELKELKKKIPAELKRRIKLEKKQALEAMKAASAEQIAALRAKAQALGLKVVKVKKAPGSKVAAKYRHPQKPGLVWSGRGRRPLWVVEWQNTGGKLEDLAVK